MNVWPRDLKECLCHRLKMFQTTVCRPNREKHDAYIREGGSTDDTLSYLPCKLQEQRSPVRYTWAERELQEREGECLRKGTKIAIKW